MDPKPRLRRLLEQLEQRDTPTFLHLPAFTQGVIAPTVIASGDFNGDGFADVAVGNKTSPLGTPCVEIALGDGAGNFTQLGTLTSALMTVPTGIVATDLNNDGIIDLAVTSSSGGQIATGSLLVFLGKGDGTFTGPSFQIGSPFNAVAAADFTNDGIPDLVAVASGGVSAPQGYQIFIGTGNGAFAPQPPVSVATDLNRVVTGDFDNDGNQDFVVVDQNDRLFTAFYGGGKGVFTTPNPGFVPINGKAFDVVSGDFNGDGLTDLIVATDTGIVFLPSLANRQFDAAGKVIQTIDPSGATPMRLATADVDRNGTPDLITVDQKQAQVFTNDGTGVFTADPGNPYAIPGVTSLADVAVSDVNGDGVIDFVTSRQSENAQPSEGNVFINLAPIPTNTIANAPSPGTEGQPITLSATITFKGRPLPLGTVPGGQVTFQVDGQAFGPANVTGGIATLPVSLPAGNHTVIAIYSGDTRFETSTSQPFPLTINPAPTKTYQYQVTGLPTLPGFGPDRVATGKLVFRSTPGGENTSQPRDILLGSGPGRVAQMTIIDGVTRQNVLTEIPFGDYTGGIMVAVGDIDGDGIDDIAVSADSGGGPRVRIYLNRAAGLTPVADFFALDSSFYGGVRVALGDVNGDGHADLVVVGGPGAGPRVAVYDGLTLYQQNIFGHMPGIIPQRLFNDFFAMDPSLRFGLFVAAGDLNGDGHADIAVSSDVGGGPQVNVFDGAALSLEESQEPVAEFFAGPVDSRGGVRIAIDDVSPQNFGIELISGDGPGVGSTVRVYSGLSIYAGPPIELFENEAFPGFTGGVFVA